MTLASSIDYSPGRRGRHSHEEGNKETSSDL